MKLRALHNEKKIPNVPKDPMRSVAKARPVWEREVQIREVETCLPMATNRNKKRGMEGDVSVQDCPEMVLAMELKRLDTSSMIIVGFDEALLERKCREFLPEEGGGNSGGDGGRTTPNPHHDPTLDMDRLASALFQTNDVWISRDVLYHALSSFASIYGFKVVKTRNQIVCKRYGTDNGNRNWTAGPWKVGCPFSLSLKALHTERRMTENPKDPEKSIAPKCRPVWEREVLIKEAHVLHGGGCRPGEERVVVMKKAPKAVHPNVVVLKGGGLVNLFTKIRGACVWYMIFNYYVCDTKDNVTTTTYPTCLITTSVFTPTCFPDENTGAADFVHYSKRIMRLLVEETVAALPTKSFTVNTPTNARYKGSLSIIDSHPHKVCLVSIIRAGDALLESFREIFPAVTVGKLWIQRDESSSNKEAIHSCTKLPPKVNEMEGVILCDPMLATGGSAITALRTLIHYGVVPERIVFANVISCPEGLDALAKEFPGVKIVTAWVDEGLNDEKFILPGLGDYGDRFFNTVDCVDGAVMGHSV